MRSLAHTHIHISLSRALSLSLFSLSLSLHHRYTKLVSRKIGHTVRSQQTADTLSAHDAAYEFSHGRARTAKLPSEPLLLWRRLRAAMRKYFGRRVELALCMTCDVFSTSNVNGALKDLETLLLSLDADSLPLGEVDRALKRRGIGEWPRALIFERLTVLGKAADQRQQNYAEARARTRAQEKTAQSHAEIAMIAAHLKEREGRLKLIETKLGIDSVDPLFAAAPAANAASVKQGKSRWTAHREIGTGRAYYSDAAGVVRWEPPADLVPCPFEGGMWVYIKSTTGMECDAPVSLASLWSMAAAGEVDDDVSVGLHGTSHFWPLKSIMRRAMTVAHLYENCCDAAAGGGDAIAIETLTEWLADTGGSAVEGSAIDLLAVFQSVDADHDGAVSRTEFMHFLLQHATRVQSLVAWIDSKW